jgi:putative ABC transport system permease protein
LRTPRYVTCFSTITFGADFQNKRYFFDLKYVDAYFWQVMAFDVLEGRPFGKPEVQSRQQVAVITDKVRKKLFGGRPALHQYLEVNGVKYRVGAVVKNAPMWSVATADVWVPLTTDGRVEPAGSLSGNYSAILLAHSRADFDGIRSELGSTVRRIALPKEYDQLKVFVNSSVERLAKGRNADEARTGVFMTVIVTLLVLFMAMPAINLININNGRIAERASEIGVRKAFGATSAALLKQFVVENLMITLAGGLLGIVLSALCTNLLLGFVETLDPLRDQDGGGFQLSGLVLGYSLLACMVFGLLSGVYPAYRMSKLNVIDALKDNKL